MPSWTLVVVPTACVLCAALFGIGVALALVAVPMSPPPRLGHRGAHRRQALEQSALFRAFEPVLRFGAGIAGVLRGVALAERLERALRRADYPGGLVANELLALSGIAALVLGLTAAGLAALSGISALVALPATVFGWLLPKLQIEELIRKRAKEITRGLPHAIEIAALCMGAGADFPGSLRLLVGSGADPRKDTPLRRELAYILEELDLGHTRREALLAFGERVKTPAVRDFVNAVLQAEEKGNPLARVIQIQGRVLSQRRSVAAEEAAARAGVLMMLPLVLLLGAVLLVLLGPIIVRAGAM